MSDLRSNKHSLYQYRYLDHGAQFRVYEILHSDGTSTNRVIKVPLCLQESKASMQNHFTALGVEPSDMHLHMLGLMLQKQRIPGILQGMYAKIPSLVALFNDTKIVPTLVRSEQEEDYFMPLFFTQTYVEPVSVFLHRFRFASLETSPHLSITDVYRARRIFSMVADAHKLMWSYGIAETSFKLDNFGINPQTKQVVLLDVGEYVFERIKSEEFIAEQKWRYSLSVSKTDYLYVPPVLHHDYLKLSEKAFSQEAFNAAWQKKSIRIDRGAIRALKIRERITRDPKKKLALWIKQQMLHDELRTSIPKERIETMPIPAEDLQLLLQDRTKRTPVLNELKIYENAERKAAESEPQHWIELYRHMFPAPRQEN